MRGQEVGHPFDPEEIQEIRRRCHPHQASDLLATGHQRLPGIGQPVHRIGATFVKRLPSIGQGELAGGALHQPRIQLRFELLHAPAHAIGRGAQPARGLGKTAATHDLHIQRNVIEVDHGRHTFVGLR